MYVVGKRDAGGEGQRCERRMPVISDGPTAAGWPLEAEDWNGLIPVRQPPSCGTYAVVKTLRNVQFPLPWTAMLTGLVVV